jgi:hypothetical protein
MQTRSAAPKGKNKKTVDVMLHNLETDVVELIGKATDYQDAMSLARRLGKVPKGLNIAGSERTDEHILLICKKGTIVAGDGVVSAVTAPKPKPKKTVLTSSQIAGPPINPDAAFAPRRPVPEVPGTLNAETPGSLFLGCLIRPLDPVVGSCDIRIEILREEVREVKVRKDIGPLELLAVAFRGLLSSPLERVRIVSKPLKMEDGALFRFERVSSQVHLTLTVHFWDGTTRICGVEVLRSATLKEIVDQTRSKIVDEPLEDDSVYEIFFEDTIARPPWIQRNYALKPKVQTAGVGDRKSVV